MRPAALGLLLLLVGPALVGRSQQVAHSRLPVWDEYFADKVSYRDEVTRWRWEGNLLAREGDDGWAGVDPATGEPRPLPPDPTPGETAAHASALAALPGWPQLPSPASPTPTAAQVAAQGAYDRGQEALARGRRGAGWVLVQHDGRVLFHRSGSPALDLGRGRLAVPDPGGRRVTLIDDHQLVIADTATGDRRVVTRDGSPDRLYGQLDWVYQEEVYGRGDWNARWWSPDGAYLALLRLDCADEPRHTLLDMHGPLSAFEQRYPRPGEPNPRAALGILDATTGALEWVDLGRFGPEALIVRVGWGPVANGAPELLAAVQDREQTTYELVAVDPRTRAVRTMLRETASGGWVDCLPLPRPLAGGGWLWESDASGRRDLVRLDATGARGAALASIGSPVRSIVGVDAGAVYVVGGAECATEQQLYRVPLDGGPATRLTREPGWHEVMRSIDGRWWIDRCSSVDTPPVVRLLDAGGAPVRELARATLVATHLRVPARRLTLRARDGYALECKVTVPPGDPPARGWPVWLSTYSGPGAPSVYESWGTDAFDQVLAGARVAAFEVNVRSASGRGMAHTRTCYHALGVRELADLEDAVAALARALPIDTGRVGITGGSYGGFIAAYAMTHSTRFRLGVAISGVYDWRLYDTIYTERYMGLPATNRAGYDKSSCIEGAPALAGALLLAHGMQDDNVHLENAVRLASALHEAGKDFELALYPGSGHGIGLPAEHRDLRRRTWRAIQRELLGP